MQTRRSFLVDMSVAAASLASCHSTPSSRSSDRIGSNADVQTVDQRVRADAAAAPLTMQFPGGSAADCTAWQARFRAKLFELLGQPTAPRNWTVRVESEAIFPDFVREQLVLGANGVAAVPLYVLRPRQSPGPWPAVLCVHGHGPFGHDPVAGRDDLPGVDQAIQSSNYDYARQLAQAGFLTAAPCLVPFGRRLGDRKSYGEQDPCAISFVRQQLLGQVLMGENVRDLLWTLNYLRSRDDVRTDRVGCVGLSYGGRMTMLTAAVDPAVGVAVVSGALNVMQERIQGTYSCGAQVIPGLLRYGDVPEIASLIAPRPLLWEWGRSDRLIDRRWAAEALQRVEKAYAAYDAKSRHRVDEFDGGHRWHGDLAVAMLKMELGQ